MRRACPQHGACLLNTKRGVPYVRCFRVPDRRVEGDPIAVCLARPGRINELKRSRGQTA